MLNNVNTVHTTKPYTESGHSGESDVTCSRRIKERNREDCVHCGKTGRLTLSQSLSQVCMPVTCATRPLSHQQMTPSSVTAWHTNASSKSLIWKCHHFNTATLQVPLKIPREIP